MAVGDPRMWTDWIEELSIGKLTVDELVVRRRNY